MNIRTASINDSSVNGSIRENIPATSSQIWTKYLNQSGILYDGRFTDVTLKAFNKEYKLHKVFLARSPVLNRLFENWQEEEEKKEKQGIAENDKNDKVTENGNGQQKEPEPEPNSKPKPKQTEDLSIGKGSLLTQHSFELMLKRLYLTPDFEGEQENAIAMIETGQYFGLPDMVEYALQHPRLEYTTYMLPFALDHEEYGDIGLQCISDCIDLITRNNYSKYIDALEKSLPNSPITMVLKKRNLIITENYASDATKADYLVLVLKALCGVYGEEKHIRILKKVLNTKVDFSNIPSRSIPQFARVKDNNGYSFIDSSVICESFEKLFLA
ncbi:unnamed protein product [Ambrosiozyma monospora]|uniref:Unnamed protein product n=1 Tax=Ambrosiozyma monospora TaxID=43982 RepID=A0A9W7DF57_AMBMO|nr:unnamed protein product [Ambrosiozyma monospora]